MEYSLQYKECKEHQSYDEFTRDGPQQCGSQISYVFFPVFIIVINIMMFSLLMAVIIDLYQSYMT